MANIEKFKRFTKIEIQKEVSDPTAWKGVRRVFDRYEEVLYELALDWDQIDCMARKAYKSKGGRSVDGAITVKAVR